LERKSLSKGQGGIIPNEGGAEGRSGISRDIKKMWNKEGIESHSYLGRGCVGERRGKKGLHQGKE